MIKFVRGRRSSRCRCRLEESQIRPDRYCCECEPGETRANLYDEITVKITAELGAGEVARKLREVIAARHCEVVARWRKPGGYPLDLHRLIPIPEDVLALGENAPAAQHWQWIHWGTTSALDPSVGRSGRMNIRPDSDSRKIS